MIPTTLVGCGTLRKEVKRLIEKNDWPVTCHMACSSLHVDLDRLQQSLEKSLAHERHNNPVVFYGTCHPLMDGILASHKTRRTAGQNCIEMLLGKKQFEQELRNGAFFLIEDWADNWRQVMSEAMGEDTTLWTEIFQSQHRYILALRTPCSEEFTAQAEAFAATVGLPLKWREASLDHLEQVLKELFTEGDHD